jgi:peptidoglycan-associated lipoprotein
MAPPPEVDPAFFDFDAYALTESARDALDRAAQVMRERPELTMMIEGHCDERGVTEYNLALGERRASAARNHLMAAGVEGDRIQIVSYGEERPFVEGHDEAAWAQNRRAHVIVQQLISAAGQ